MLCPPLCHWGLSHLCILSFRPGKFRPPQWVGSMSCHIRSTLIVKSTHKAAVRNLVEIFLHAPRRENNHLCSARAQPHERARKNTSMDAEKGTSTCMQCSRQQCPGNYGISAILVGSVDRVFQTDVSEIPACICCEVVIPHGSTSICTIQSLS